MLYDVRAARDNIRNKDGKRVFYLGPGDQLTPSARDVLSSMRVQILPPPEKGAPKPEHMTHLNGDTLVPKTHPAIRFRGAVDTLEAEILLCGAHCPHLQQQLQPLLDLTRQLIAADVLGEPVRAYPSHPGSALGVAFLAGMQAGLYTDWTQINSFLTDDRVYTPAPEATKVYERAYKIYRGLYEQLQPAYEGIEKLYQKNEDK